MAGNSKHICDVCGEVKDATAHTRYVELFTGLVIQICGSCVSKILRSR